MGNWSWGHGSLGHRVGVMGHGIGVIRHGLWDRGHGLGFIGSLRKKIQIGDERTNRRTDGLNDFVTSLAAHRS